MTEQDIEEKTGNKVIQNMTNVTADQVRNAIRSYESDAGGYAPGVLRVRQIDTNESIVADEWESLVESMIKPVGRLLK